MALINYAEECIKQDKRSVSMPDGGVINIWLDGARFRAAIDKNVSTEARIAFANTNVEQYIVQVDKNVMLERNDYFQQVKTGAYIRIKNTGMDTPEKSGLARKQFEAEFISFNRDDLP